MMTRFISFLTPARRRLAVRAGHRNPRSSGLRTATCALGFLAASAPGPAWSATGPAVADFEVYDQAFPALLQKWQVPGAAVAVAYKGRLVFSRGYGYADRDTLRPVQPDTRFRIGSISKPITAAMILKLVEDGRLSLDDHPFVQLGYPPPVYRGAKRDARLDQVTVGQLLNHTGGWLTSTADNPIVGGHGFDPQAYQRQIAQIMGARSPASSETIIRYMIGQPLQADPGTAWDYSPFGFSVLGRLIELKTGLTYEEAVRQFFANSGISGLTVGGSRRSELAADEAVYYDYPGAPLVQSHLDSAMVPGPYQWWLQSWDAQGGWTMSAIECVRFLLALDGEAGMPPLLQPGSVTAMQTMVYPASLHSYGLGWSVHSYPRGDSGHSGGLPGTSAMALVFTDGNTKVAAFFNSKPADGQFYTEIYNAIHTLPVSLAQPDHDMTWTTLSWDAWQNLYFGGNPSADLADPDNDGVPNLLEYSAGLDPTEATPEPPATFELQSDGRPVLTYRRIILEHPLSWTLETSADGQTWRSSPATLTATVLNADGTLSALVSLPGARHVRLHVQRLVGGARATLELALEPFPVFTTQPVSQTVTDGSRLTFTAYATGKPSPSYQWQRQAAGSNQWDRLSNDGKFSGVTGATLTVNRADTTMSGDLFRCLGTNAVGSAISDSAILTVSLATTPAITTQPASQTVITGHAFTFSVAASGSPVPTFQWQKGSVNISGATNSSYYVGNATASDIGTYTVVATNSAGSATSTAATLTVNPVPLPPAPAASGGGGGGGAVTPWFLTVLSLLSLVRHFRCRPVTTA